MDWSRKNRAHLKIDVTINIKSSIQLALGRVSGRAGIQRKKLGEIKKYVYKRSKNICRYCGGKYNKYKYCIQIDKGKDKSNYELDNLDMCCKVCYLITHINNDFKKEMKLYWSTKSQVDIVKETVDYIIKNQSIPIPNIIYKNVKVLPL